MKLSEHKDLKKEILALPPKEKDKLSLRLIAKDKVLTEHLHFLLLEDEEDLITRVTVLKEEISAANKIPSSAKEVLVNLRKQMRLVNHFLKVTKANLEDVELRIFLLNDTKTEFKGKIFSSFKNYEQLFAIFFVKSVRTTLNKYQKLHEDLQFDLREDFDKLLQKGYSKTTAAAALALELPEKI